MIKNCKLANYCGGIIPCSSNGNCFYDIISQYMNSEQNYVQASMVKCFCNKGYLTKLDQINTISCCYKQKELTKAFLLELLINFGAGHFYVGNIYSGLAKLIISITLLSVCLLCLIVMCNEKKNDEEKRKCNFLGYIVISSFAGYILLEIIDLCLFGCGYYKDSNGEPLSSW